MPVRCHHRSRPSALSSGSVTTAPASSFVPIMKPLSQVLLTVVALSLIAAVTGYCVWYARTVDPGPYSYFKANGVPRFRVSRADGTVQMLRRQGEAWVWEASPRGVPPTLAAAP